MARPMSDVRRLVVVAALGWACCAASPSDPARDDTIFFGMNVGTGVASVDQADLSGRWRGGLVYDAAFGFGLSDQWAAGLELATWQPLNLNGDPTHVHQFGVRAEYALSGPDGWIAASSVGLALGDGRATKRLGGGGLVQLGHRWALGRWVAIAVEGGVHGAVYKDGTALAPFLAVQLRFYGQRPRD